MAADVRVRPARADERVAVLGVLDAAMLETDAEVIAERIADGRVLVAVAGGPGDGTEDDTSAEASPERVVGAIEVSSDRGDAGGHVEAIAVRRRRRGRGIGTALVEAAAARWRPLSAGFDDAVRPFYVRVGFEIRDAGDGRYRGRLD